MAKISVIHFQPLEYFPPGLNFVRYLSAQDGLAVSVSTTRQVEQPFNIELSEKVKLNVFKSSSYQVRSRLGRAVKYFEFVFSAICHIFRFKPDVIVYFDPYSAWPGILYKLLFNRKVKLWIHFHEYFAPDWYSNGMVTSRAAHFLEKKIIFQKAFGVSHTNADRIRLFLNDHPKVDGSKVFAFPNYPPGMWAAKKRRIDDWDEPTKFVAIGSFTLKGSYLEEFCNWVEQHNGKMELDIYSLYLDKETEIFLKQQNSELIRLHTQGVPYDEIPGLFEESGFHIGLVLYRCNSLNTIYCAPNKLFEYLVGGLDVWYPEEMVGTAPFVTNEVYPKVVPIDYCKLDEMDFESLRSRAGHSYDPKKFDCETVCSDWTAKLVRPDST